jgi:hypothetical protein
MDFDCILGSMPIRIGSNPDDITIFHPSERIRIQLHNGILDSLLSSKTVKPDIAREIFPELILRRVQVSKNS